MRRYPCWGCAGLSLFINLINQLPNQTTTCSVPSTHPLQVHHAAASCPEPPASCTWKQFESKSPNPQVLQAGCRERQLLCGGAWLGLVGALTVRR